jgi:tetratricopeptide (TPR) repeat protein/TolB-like protein
MPPPPDERRARAASGSPEPPAAARNSPTVPGDGVTPVDAIRTENVASGDAAPTAALPEDAGGAPAFSRDELVAARYRIVRFIARGGMGEVYEAEDLELGVRVALKTVRPDAEGRSQATERFKREIQLARQVTHPNVCRIFDLVRHTRTSATGPGQDVLCLTMELLAGETLLDRLRRRGAMSTAEALPVVEQVASALSAAHRVGVVHRDFKSPNVMLVPAGTDGQVRAVVTDFGLARASAGSASGAVTATAKILGTPAYMAPEQVEGKPVTAAADIYALGVVIYEMVTSRRPFAAADSLALAVKRLTEPPPSPRVHVPDLDPVWEAVILICLRVDPTQRFAAAEDVVGALRGDRLPTTLRIASGTRGRRRLVAGAVATLLVAGVLGYRAVRPSRSTEAVRPADATPPGVPTRARPVVAVLGFKDLGGKKDYAWLSAALSEMLASELAAGESIRVVAGENVARMKLDLALVDTDDLRPDRLSRVGGHLGADRVVVGSYLALGPGTARRLRLDVRIQATSDGETLASFSETGSEAELFDLVSRAGSRLRTRLGAGMLSEADARALRASIPSSPRAARAYSEGLARLRVFDAVGARPLLEQAVRADRAHPLFHAALAEAWSALGYDAMARAEAKEAFERSAALSREERLAVEARYRETTKEWNRAVEIHQSLWNFFPDNLEYGLRLAAAEERAGKRKEALATVEAVRRLPAPDGEDPRIDLAEAGVAYRLSDFARQRAAAERAATKAGARGARLLVAAARLNGADAAWALGEPDRALALYSEAQAIFDAAGDRSGVARTLSGMANLHYRQGRLAEASDLYERSLAVFRETGNDFAVAWTLHSFANVLSDGGDLAGSRKLQEQALAIHRRIGDRGGEAGSLGNIANLLQYQGDLAGARRMHEQALAIFRDVAEKGPAAIELNNIAIVLAAQGDLKGAQALLEEALALKRETGNRSSIAFTLAELGGLAAARGDLGAARKHHEEAARIREALGQKARAAESRLALATVSLDTGQAAAAEAVARETADVFRAEKMGDLEGAARLVLARSLAVQGKGSDARQAVQEASRLLSASQDRAVRLSLAIAAARVDGAAADPGAASSAERLVAAAAEATRMGHVALELDARLALAEVEVRNARPQARERALQLEKEARAKGFGLIATKVAALQSPPK